MDKVFDCHLHIENGLEKYNFPLGNANIIFNYVENYKKYKDLYSGYYHSLIFDYQNHFEYIKQLVHEKKIRALKIHSRLQKFNESRYPEIIDKLKELNTNVPVIYDGFYYNSDLEYQPSLKGLITMAKALPDNKFIIAHSGGIHVLEYFFHLRDLGNIGFDLSFSLQYLSDTSCYVDLVKLIKYSNRQNVFFGTDYPSADPSFQIGVLRKIFDELKLTNEERDEILNKNWIKFTEY